MNQLWGSYRDPESEVLHEFEWESDSFYTRGNRSNVTAVAGFSTSIARNCRFRAGKPFYWSAWFWY